MTTEAVVPYQVDTEMMGGRIHVHVHLPDHEGAVDYHWYVDRGAAENQDPEKPVFDVERAANFFGEFGVGLNRRTVDRITRAINFDIPSIPSASDRQNPPQEPEPPKEPGE